jgi:hypothetical protein
MIDSPTASTASCTGVHDLVAGVGERARDHLRAAVVAVEAGLGDENAELAVTHG